MLAASWRPSSTAYGSFRRAVHDQRRQPKLLKQRPEFSRGWIGTGKEAEERFLGHVQVGLHPLLDQFLGSRLGDDVGHEDTRCALDISR